MKAKLLFLALLLTGGIFPTQTTGVVAADWPQWRGPMRDGTSTETNWSHAWKGEPKRLWKAAVGTGFSSIAVAEGSAYTQGNVGGTNLVWCLDALTGIARWQFAHAESLMSNQFEGGPTSTPLVADGRVFTASRAGLVHCLNARTGALFWEQSLAQATGLKMKNWGLNGSPLLMGGKLFLNWGTAGVALNPADGHVDWLSGPDEWSYTSLVPGRWGEREVLFVSAANQLAVVNPTDGAIRWSLPFHVGFKGSDPVPVGDLGVFFGANETGGAFIRFDGEKPTMVWNKSELGTFTGGAVLVDGYLYAILSNRNDKGDLACFEPSTGNVLWSQGGYGWGSLLAAGDRLLVLSVKGEFSVLKASPQKAQVMAHAQILGGKCWTTPALAEGRLYARNGRGDLVCIDLRPTPGRGNPATETF